MKKKALLLAVLLCVSGCGNAKKDLPSDTTNSQPTISDTNSQSSSSDTSSQPAEHKHTYKTTLSYDSTHHWYESTCGHDDAIVKIKHTFSAKETPPTYESKGYTTYSCEDCEYSYIGNEKEVLKHNYSNELTYDEHTHWYPCIDKGYETLKKDEQPHDFEAKVTEPTYESKGYTTYACKECEYSYIDDSTDILKHNYSNELTYDEHTHWYPCIDKGYETLKKDEQNHKFKTEITEPTYEEKGYTTYTCEECGYNYISDITDVLRYSIKYNLDGGTNSLDNPDSFTTEDYIMLSMPKKDGYGFLGWYDNNGNKVETIEKGTNYDIELTARWSYLFVIENNVLVDFDETIIAYEARIPHGVTKIANGAFEDSYYLFSVIIPSSVTSMEKDAFAGCTNLTYVCYEGTLEQWCKIKFEYNTASPMFYGEQFCLLNENNEWYEVNNIVIPNSVTSIGNYQFYDFDNIESITIPNSVTTIDYFAFRSCISLQTIIFEQESKLTSIGEDAFSDCRSLQTVQIPNGVTSIGDSAFEECKALQSIDIPSSVKTIGKSAFSDCSALTSVTIPSGLTSISDYMFVGCSSLTSIIIPNSIKTIGRQAFSYCTAIKTIDIPNSVTSINDYAFAFCYELKAITIPSSVTTLGINVFDECIELVIYCQAKSQPSGWAISWNTSYCVVYWSKTSSDILVIDGVQYIVENGTAKVSAFLDSKENVVIASTVNINGKNYSVTAIGESAFWGCDNLKSLVIPSSITTIEEYAFLCFDVVFYCEAASQPSGWNEDLYDGNEVYWANEWEYNSENKPVPLNN